MRVFARIQAVSLRYAPVYCLCVILGAYVSLQVASSVMLVG